MIVSERVILFVVKVIITARPAMALLRKEPRKKLEVPEFGPFVNCAKKCSIQPKAWIVTLLLLSRTSSIRLLFKERRGFWIVPGRPCKGSVAVDCTTRDPTYSIE